jgi:hypothetical protein
MTDMPESPDPHSCSKNQESGHAWRAGLSRATLGVCSTRWTIGCNTAQTVITEMKVGRQHKACPCLLSRSAEKGTGWSTGLASTSTSLFNGLMLTITKTCDITLHAIQYPIYIRIHPSTHDSSTKGIIRPDNLAANSVSNIRIEHKLKWLKQRNGRTKRTRPSWRLRRRDGR